MRYKPETLDTSGVTLPEDMLELSELLARNTHEHWARQRLADGWSYGPVRDDASKQHPCLIPYEDLPESEKQYDRTTSVEALKAILLLGYRLESPAPAPERPEDASSQGSAIASSVTKLESDADES